jgi:protein-disulfide isomerase
VSVRDVQITAALIGTFAAALLVNDAVVERRVESYWQDHPEIVADIISKANSRKSAATNALMGRTLHERWKDLSMVHAYAVRFNGSQFISRLVKMSEVATPNTLNLVITDYRCGYCKRDRDAVDTLLRANPNLDFVFIDAPLLGPDSANLAKDALLQAQRRDADYYAIHNKQFDAAPSADGAKQSDIDVLEEQKHFLDTIGIFATPTYARGGTFQAGALGTTHGG